MPAPADQILRFPTAAEGIAAENALQAEARPGFLLWEAETPAIVLPWHFSKDPGFAAAAEEARAAGWPLITRPTGGGAVPQGPGSLNLAMVWPAGPELGIEAAYRRLCAPLIAAFAEIGLDAEPGATEGSFCDGTFNLSVGGRKLVGTAQRWRSLPGENGGPRQRIVLAHALVLTDPPLGPAVARINALHKALGLAPVRGEVHVSLRSLLPDLDAPGFAALLARKTRESLT